VLSAEWHFTTTSHGNGQADGMGGTVKRLAAKTSLQKVYNNQIQTPHELFNYCSRNICNMTLFYVQENKFLTIRRNLQNDLLKRLKSNSTDILVSQTITISSVLPVSMMVIGGCVLIKKDGTICST
jgi:hypothetical protein